MRNFDLYSMVALGFDGSGNFTRTRGSAAWQGDAAAKVKIRADLHDSNDNEFADALSLAILRDGRSQVTADIPFGGKKITQLGAGVNPTDAVNYGQIADVPNIHGQPDKALPVDADELIIANSQSAPAWQKAKITLLALKNVVTAGLGAAIHALTAKPVIVDLDEFMISDSVSTPTAWASKRMSWANLQSMIGIASGQRLGKAQGSTLVANFNLAIETGFYVNGGIATNGPMAGTPGYLIVIVDHASQIYQEWHEIYQQASPLIPRSYERRMNSGVWGAWRLTTSINALLKTEDGIISGAGYTQSGNVLDVISGSAYTPSPAGGNMREVHAVGGAWTFNAPAYVGSYTMAVVIYNAIASGAVTFSGFTKVSGRTHPTTQGAASVVYITKMGGAKTAFVDDGGFP